MTSIVPRSAPKSIATLRAGAAAAQRALVGAETVPGQIVRAEACPGAGKTRTIVERHLNRPPGPRQGRALVSFTKVAGREIRKRCVEEGRPELAQFPHFIGTFDAFVWRHLLRPYLLPKTDRVWHRLEEWSDHPQARRDGATLDDFAFSYSREGVRTADPQPVVHRLPHRFQRSEEQRNDLTRWAKFTMQSLWNQGYLAGDQLRDMAFQLLSHTERRARIGRVLRARFCEVVIDESQDCSSEDRRIVSLLRELGIPLLLVGDPDQSIYGFRDATSPRTAAALGALQGTPPDHRLAHNWRSTQIICDLTHTLRTSDAPCDIAVGPHYAESTPVLLLPTSGRSDAAWLSDFAEYAKRIGVPRNERLVVAHGNSSLPKELTGTRIPPTNQLGRLVWATAVLRSPGSSSKHQERAHKVLREAVLRHWYGAPDTPESVNLARLGLSPLELQVIEQSVLHSLPPLDEPAGTWSREAHGLLTAKASSLGLVPQVQRAYPCSEHDDAAWRLVGFGAPAPADLSAGRASTVHGVKGDQADAVLIVVPTDTPKETRSTDLVRAWTKGPTRTVRDETGEALRVLYVAASRARRLLAFALDDTHLTVVESFLATQGIPCISAGEQLTLPL
ncbi:UvrD-helicase domain-containing protein [Streptomyces sp. NPDC056240]|uniref:UvrD-helicase domain-containing protein n=1 Tax=Streptomyces sp. NPDC056240 TaxID=3345759 RepID=UPI0035E1807A